MEYRVFCCATTIFLLIQVASITAVANDSIQKIVRNFNFRIGTQQVGVAKLSSNTPTVELAAREMLNMGATVCKLSLSSRYQRQLGIPQNEKIVSIKTLLQEDSSLNRILRMPFSHYVFWVYPFSSEKMPEESGGIPGSEEALRNEYLEIYDLVIFLRKKFSGTGKTFYLGNWEGDWHLFPGRNPNIMPDQNRIINMAKWFDTRHQAILDAYTNSQDGDADVYFYIEVNQGLLAYQGKPCVLNSIFPLLKRSPDFISISSYSIQNLPANEIAAILDYHEAKLDKRIDIEGKRVFIGEYGYSRRENITEEKRAQLYLETAIKYMSWGPRFILSWQIFDNQFKRNDTGKNYSFIDNSGVHSSVYEWQKKFLKQARAWLAAYYKKHQKIPDNLTYQRKALSILSNLQKEKEK